RARALLEGQVSCRLWDDERAHPLAQDRVGHRHARHVEHDRMGQDQVLDLLRADLLAAAIDQVFLPPLDDVVPRRMAAHQVAGHVKAVGCERPSVVFGDAVIATERVGPAHEQLPNFTVLDRLTLLIHENDFVVRADRTANRVKADLVGIVQTNEHQQALGHAEDLLDTSVREDRLRTALHFGLQLLAAGVDDAHRAEVEVSDRGRVDVADEQSGNQLEVGDALAFDDRQYIVHASSLAENDVRALPEESAYPWAGQRKVVGDRQDHQQTVVGVHVVDGGRRLGVIDVVVVSPGNELRDAGRAPRELEDAWLLRI